MTAAPTVINRPADYRWQDRPTFYIETRSPITPELQCRTPSKNKARFRYGIGGLREIWDKKQWRNRWVWPLSEGEEIAPDDDETFIVVGGSEITREECTDMVAYMREKANRRRAARQQKRPTAQQVRDALNVVAEARIAAARGKASFVVPVNRPMALDRIPANQVKAMAEVAKSGFGMGG